MSTDEAKRLVRAARQGYVQRMGHPLLLQHGLDELALVQEARTMHSELKADTLLWYTDQRWIGYTDGRALYFSNHDTDLCAVLYFISRELERLAKPRELRWQSEDQLCTEFVTALSAEGWTCQREVYTPYGRIDVLATSPPRMAVIEVKLLLDGNAMKASVGQLLAYGMAYPEAELWLAVPQAIHVRWHSMLERYNITIREVPWTNRAV